MPSKHWGEACAVVPVRLFGCVFGSVEAGWTFDSWMDGSQQVSASAGTSKTGRLIGIPLGPPCGWVMHSSLPRESFWGPRITDGMSSKQSGF